MDLSPKKTCRKVVKIQLLYLLQQSVTGGFLPEDIEQSRHFKIGDILR